MIDIGPRMRTAFIQYPSKLHHETMIHGCIRVLVGDLHSYSTSAALVIALVIEHVRYASLP
jgi:hypothetical protein